MITSGSAERKRCLQEAGCPVKAFRENHTYLTEKPRCHPSQYGVNVEIVDRLFSGLHTFFAFDLRAAVLFLVPAFKLLCVLSLKYDHPSLITDRKESI